jgi:RNA polymerase sigma-70 factor (ECF subfamily)
MRDQAAFADMLDAWSPGLLRVARTYVSSTESAADLVQDTWLAVIEGIDRFEGRSSVKTWVYRILTNTAKRRGMRESRSVPWSSLPADDDLAPTVDPDRFQAPSEQYPGHWREFPSPWPTSVVPSPEGRALAAEIVTELDHALAELPGRQRVVITLRDVEGLTSDEVCEVLDISPANQRVLLHRARAFVRSRLETYFAGDTDERAEGV